ncbi:MAG: TIR domain-containing protein, partial [Solirubrobacterales bacterium]
MPDLSGFPNDVFISYTHRDNLPEDPGDSQTGWVSRFHWQLQRRLTELLGREAKVWRDPKLGAADVFSHELEDQLKSTAVLVPVVSPGYSLSKWCRRELETFQEAAEAQGGFEVRNKVRAAKVIKTPIDGDQQRAIVSDALGREFFERLADSGYIREFEAESAEFRTAVDLLAQDIKKILDALSSQRGVKVAERGIVYLAETTSDLAAERQLLRQELEAFQYRVLPAESLPDEAGAFSTAVKSAIEQARLSVHLFGARYGMIPESADQSVPTLQYSLAQERGLARIAWIRDGAEPEARQADFLEKLRQAPGTGLELLERRTVEQLKSRVLALLAPRAPEPPPPTDGLVRI